jgi:hypothetical protein
MTPVYLPDDVGTEPLVRQLRALGLEPDTQPAAGALHLAFRWRQMPAPQHSTCAAAGCTQPGTVRWDDAGPLYCADHAWPNPKLSPKAQGLRAELEALRKIEGAAREHLGHYRHQGQAGLAAEIETDLADMHTRQAQLEHQLEQLSQEHDT